MAIQGGVMQYVLCPVCGDPVGGRFPALGKNGKKLTCTHCRNSFPFNQRFGLALQRSKSMKATGTE